MGKGRLVIAAIIALFAIISYFGTSSENPLTGEKQRVALTPEQEIALGYKSAPEMAAQMGGVSRNAQAVALVQRVGELLVKQSFAAKSPYKFSQRRRQAWRASRHQTGSSLSRAGARRPA
jgi:predicted Zn-dependent protease